MAISKAKINTLVKKAFNSLGDIPLAITYTYVTPGTYDPLTDTLTSSTVVVTDVPAVNVKLKEQEMDWFPTDINTQKLLIAAVDLPNPPSASDYVTIASVRWEVKRVSRVPGDSLYILYIQEP
jgi:hypothetical protein